VHTEIAIWFEMDGESDVLRQGMAAHRNAAGIKGNVGKCWQGMVDGVYGIDRLFPLGPG
jgi:hypothetical protein